MVAFATWIVSFFIVCIAGIFVLAILIRIIGSIFEDGEEKTRHENPQK